MYYNFNYYYLIVLAFFVTFVASIYLRSNYNKYKKIRNKNELTGFDVARKILDENGLTDILILEVQGDLTDHYDSSRKVVKLSSSVYHDTSIVSLAVAAHECGHAVQHKNNYTFLKFRNMILPVVNFSSKVGYIALLLGFLLSINDLIWIGIMFEFIILLFQLLTLPVEFDASKKALIFLDKYQIMHESEKSSCKKMLVSAALTYVAGLLSSFLELLRLVMIASDRDNK